MRNEKFKNAYPNPSEDFHNAVLSSLYKLDNKSTVRYRNHRIAKLAFALAIIIALGSFTVVAAATKFFGLFSEPVGKYGLRVGVELETAEMTNEPLMVVKMHFGYMTDGFEELPNTEADLKKFQNPNDDSAGSYSFSIVPASEFNYTERYIIDSEESMVNGHKIIVSTRQMSESGELDYLSDMYFDDWGYVVRGGAYQGASKNELIKIMKNLSLEEETETTHETVSADTEPDELVLKRREYDRTVNSSFKMHRIGEIFDWGRDENSNDFSVRISSIKEQSNTDGIPEEYFNWMSDYSLIYPEFFDESGNLITPYTRHDITDSDGINTQRKEWDTEDDRHFFVVTVEITQNTDTPFADFDLLSDFFPIVLIKDNNGNYQYNDEADEYGVTQSILYGNIDTVFSTPGDEANILHMSKGETRTLSFGIVVDDDVLDNAYLRFNSKDKEIIDDQLKTVTQSYANDCIKLKE